MHRRVVLFIAVLAALALGSPAGAAAKSPSSYAPTAAEAQQATTACGPGGVGDQLVPDSGPWFNFTAACANHDACYGAQRGQLYCDQGFRDDMYAHCVKRVWYQRGLCRGTAKVYYDAVRRFGHLFYGG
jgi:hypothetical protein